MARPVEYGGTTFTIGQTNSTLIYPGPGLGIIVSQAARVTPHMLQAAAAAVAEQADASQPGAPLLPGLHDLRATSALVAEAVARAAVADQVRKRQPHKPHPGHPRRHVAARLPRRRLNPDTPGSLADDESHTAPTSTSG